MVVSPQNIALLGGEHDRAAAARAAAAASSLSRCGRSSGRLVGTCAPAVAAARTRTTSAGGKQQDDHDRPIRRLAGRRYRRMATPEPLELRTEFAVLTVSKWATCAAMLVPTFCNWALP